jgi:hypothetical protein
VKLAFSSYEKLSLKFKERHFYASIFDVEVEVLFCRPELVPNGRGVIRTRRRRLQALPKMQHLPLRCLQSQFAEGDQKSIKPSVRYADTNSDEQQH